MRQSEKILLAILVLGLLAWQGGRLVNRLLFDPIRRSRAELARLDEQIAEQKDQAAEFSGVESRLQRWRERSLPPEPLTAQRLYQRWLTDLAHDCGFESLRVFPDQVRRKSDACTGVVVSVDASARLSQLCLFLSRFYRTDLAQQITLLSIDSTQDRGDPILRVTIMAEGLSMRDAPQRQRLFPTSTLAREMGEQDSTVQIVDGADPPAAAGSLVRIGGEYLRVVTVTEKELKVERGVDGSLPRTHGRGELVEFVPLIGKLASTTPADYATLVARNPFSKPTLIVVEQPSVVPEAPSAIDPAEFTYLVAAFAEEDKREAWLYDRLNDKNIVVDLGNSFSVAGVEGVLHDIGDGFIVLDYGSSRWRLQLGNNLRSMERVSGTGDNAAEPTDDR
jgi:hypothetical protein